MVDPFVYNESLTYTVNTETCFVIDRTMDDVPRIYGLIKYRVGPK